MATKEGKRCALDFVIDNVCTFDETIKHKKYLIPKFQPYFSRGVCYFESATVTHPLCSVYNVPSEPFNNAFTDTYQKCDYIGE